MYWAQSWWTGIFATNCLATSVVNGFPVTLASGCVVDTLHNDAFPGTLAVINCEVRNQVGGVAPNGSPYHSDIWQERVGLTGENILIYGVVAEQNCVGQGFFTRGSPHHGIAFVQNLVCLRGYPNQTQFLSRVNHLVFANNTILGAPVSIGLTDSNSSVEAYAGSTNAIFKNNVFQWVSMSDPRGQFPAPLGMTSFAGGTQFVDNHFMNAWPAYESATGVPYGALVLGSGSSTGTSVPAGRGSSRGTLNLP